MDELAAAASVFAMEVDSDAGDGIGIDDDPMEPSRRVLQEWRSQPGADCSSGIGVDAARGEDKDASKQVMPAHISTASTRYAQPLARYDSTCFVLR